MINIQNKFITKGPDKHLLQGPEIGAVVVWAKVKIFTKKIIVRLGDYHLYRLGE